MNCRVNFMFIFIFVLHLSIEINSADKSDSWIEKKPKLVIVSFVRNKAHILPLFLSYLEQLDYPKDRISLWLQSDHNEDNSIEILEKWLLRTEPLYHSVRFQYDKSKKRRVNETSIVDWPVERYIDLIQMKEESLEAARKMWADYVFFLDADVILTYPATLYTLMDLELPIVAPMLISDSLYSNFWCGMSENYYYRRTEDYKKIRHFDMMGEYPVPMIHSAVLVDLNKEASDLLTFDKEKLNKFHHGLKNYDGPIDDVIIFAISANFSDTELYVSNTKNYGYLTVPLDPHEDLERDFSQLINVKLFINNHYGSVNIKPDLMPYVRIEKKTKLTLSEIFMINLERRTERREKMEHNFEIMGLDVKNFPAVDGKKLNHEVLKEKGIKLLPEYVDPYHKRPMTMGEVGCFLSHYSIWERMVEQNLAEVLILEDDIKFEPYFKERATFILNQAREFKNWDLIYFGRKRLQDSYEELLPGSEVLAKVGYSYWTLGYLISLEGAKKLLDAKPLQKLVPVDEFLPIMFNQHPNETWKEKFPNRNLVAWSSVPLILFPTHYTGEDGYISDTEDSVQIKLTDDLISKGDKNEFDEMISAEESQSFLKSTIHGIKEHSRDEL